MAANMKNNKTEYQTGLLLEKLEEYSKENSDFSVFCRNGKEVKSSKMLLASRSEYFSNLFTKTSTNGRQLERKARCCNWIR